MEEKDFKIAELEAEEASHIEKVEQLTKDLDDAKFRIEELEASQQDESQVAEEIDKKMKTISQLQDVVAALTEQKTLQDANIAKMVIIDIMYWNYQGWVSYSYFIWVQ